MSAAVVFLHGSGDTGKGIEAWLQNESSSMWQAMMEAAEIKLVYPTAPPVPYTLFNGEPSTVWFDRKQMAYEAPEDKEGVARSVSLVDDEIDKLVADGCSLDRIAVCGMSMGGCLAMHVAFGAGRHSGKLGAAAALSCFLAEDSGLDGVAKGKDLSETPLFMGHGTDDPMIPVLWAEATRKRLEDLGALVPPKLPLFKGMGHSLCNAEVTQLADFLATNLKAEEEE